MRVNIPYTNQEYADLAVYCNENNCHIVNNGEYLESVPNDPYIPTNDEISKLREQAYVNEIDILHAQKFRRTILGTWTEQDELEYREKVIFLSEEIAERYPYRDEEESSSD